MTLCKVTERSLSTFPQTYTFFVINISVQMVFQQKSLHQQQKQTEK